MGIINHLAYVSVVNGRSGRPARTCLRY